MSIKGGGWVDDSNIYAANAQGRPGNRTVFLGDSVTKGGDTLANIVRSSCFPTYAGIASGQRIWEVNNAGNSGDRTDQMLARFDTDVTPYAPNCVVILGGTNDTGQSIALSTIQANIKAIVAKCYSIGAKPVLCTIPPNSTGSPADRKTRILDLNTWLRIYTAKNGITLVDFYDLLVDPANGNYLAAYNNDGTHPNTAGYAAMGSLVSSKLAPLLPDWQPPLAHDNSDPRNLWDNSLFLTDAGGDGIPDGWTKNGSNATPSIVTGDTAIKGNWTELAVSNSTGGTDLIYFGTFDTVTAGNRYSICGRIKSSGLSSACMAIVKLRFTGATTDFNPVYNLDQDVDGVFYIEGVAPVGVTGAQVQIQLVTTAGGSGSVQVAQLASRDLTLMGALN